jgi:hypothetical protein
VEAGEHIGKHRFLDSGAVVYRLKCIPGQVPGFSIEKCIDRLEILHQRMSADSHLDFIMHRFFIVALKGA